MADFVFYYWQFLQFLQLFQELFVGPSYLSLLVRNVNSNPLILDLMYLFLKRGYRVRALVYQQYHFFFFPRKFISQSAIERGVEINLQANCSPY